MPWDYVHANSVDEEPDGALLMSARSTWAVYEIDRATGRLRWRLGGKRSDFRLGPGASFAWQHDARRRADGSLSLFDNSAAPPVRKRSRAISLVLDPAARTATLRSAVTHPRGLLSATQGNAQPLPGGGQIVGWGSQRYFSEYAADGRLLFNARLAVGFESYRAHRGPWSGRPHTQPRAIAGAARRRHGRLRVLERRHRRGELGGARGGVRRGARAGGGCAARRVRDPDPRRRGGGLRRGAGARPRGRRARHVAGAARQRLRRGAPARTGARHAAPLQWRSRRRAASSRRRTPA